MKRFLVSILLLMLIFCLCACQDTSKEPDEPEFSEQESESQTEQESEPAKEQEWMHVACSKKNVDVFYQLYEQRTMMAGYVDKGRTIGNCFNVTPAQVASETDIQIFKFRHSGDTFAMIGDDYWYIGGEWRGGYGFVNAVPCDFDNDGNKDLLVASSWGSGLHRSVISVFNVTTKESTVIYDTSMTDNPSIDLFVVQSSPSSFPSEDPSDLPVGYLVYSANIESDGDNLAKLSYCVTGFVGAIAVENGEIVFRSAEKQ